MDARTLAFYEAHAESLAHAWERGGGELPELIRRTFPPGTRVVDVGCGSGRDLAGLASDRIDAWGIEPSEQLRRVVQERHEILRGRIVEGHLPDGLPLPAALGGAFDGLLCVAVLQHVARESLLASVLALKRLLAPGARAIVSIPRRGPATDGSDRDDGGRHFSGVTAAELRLLFERAGFLPCESLVQEDGLGRAGRTWDSLVLRLDADGSARPLDVIAGVIETDRKTATYKLALLRALCEIARRESRCVRWRAAGGSAQDGDAVAVPLVLVAERWLQYYWPFVARQHSEFIPQMQGDWSRRRHGLGFATDLAELARSWGAAGPAAFAIARRAGALKPAQARLSDRAMRSLARAIRTGPVVHAGRSSGGRALLGIEGGDILVPSDLWREIALMGHWIEDSLLLRWAETCSRFTKGELRPSVVLDRLLEPLDPERDQADGRAAYADMLPLACTWTGESLARSWEADHVIPYSVWRNNELWNLVPASKRANASKAAALPSRDLLRSRRDAILRCWAHVSGKMPRRFEAEARMVTGAASPSEALLFDALVDLVETTALDRALPRWPA